MTKDIVLIRHAHRDTGAGRLVDNGLSPKGKKQAKSIREFYRSQFLATPAALWSSPYQRCVETLRPLGKSLEQEVLILPTLAEQQPEESTEAFAKRVKGVAKDCLSGEFERLLICSHGDLLPMLLEELTGNVLWLRKGAWVHLRIEPSEIRIEMLLQRVSNVLMS